MAGKSKTEEPHTFRTRTRQDGIVIGYEGQGTAVHYPGVGELIIMAPDQATLELAWHQLKLGNKHKPIVRDIVILHPKALQEQEA